MILMNYKTSWKHESITCNNYMQQLHVTIKCISYMPVTSKKYLQQLHATCSCNSYMQKLLATITCNSYMQQLQAKITCNNYMQQLYATFTSKNYLHALCTCTLRITILFFMSQRLLGGLLIFFLWEKHKLTFI